MSNVRKIGTKVDRLFKLKEEKKKAETSVKKISEKINSLEKEIFNSLKEENLEGAMGKVAKISISKSTYPSVENWDKFYKYIQKTGDFDLLQRRPSTQAYRSRLEDGEKIPGVTPFTKISMNLRKL